MNKKQWLGLGLVTVAAIGLAACGNRASKKDSANSESKTDLKAAIVTDTGGVDDKSFNQSAWEGLQAWGKENGLSKGNGFDYFQSTDESQYATNLDEAVSNDYKLIFGVGFALRDAVEKRLLTTKKQTLLSLTTVLKVKERSICCLCRQRSWLPCWYRCCENYKN